MNGLFTIDDVLTACVSDARPYSYETRLRAVTLVLVHDWYIQDAAADAGASRDTVSRWVREAKAKVQRALDNRGRRFGRHPESAARALEFRAVIRRSCEACGSAFVAFFGTGRHPMTVLAREVSVWVGHEVCQMSYPMIAMLMNRPNHSSVITMIRRFEDHRDESIVTPTGIWTRRALGAHVAEKCKEAA